MNSLIWKDNVEMLQEMFREMCSEEETDCNYPLQIEFNKIIKEYATNVTHTSQLSSINKSILFKCMEIIQANKTTLQVQHQDVPKRIVEQPKEVYSRDDISKERQQVFDNKFNNAQQDFASFHLKKPEEVSFNDKVEEDSTTVEERIERELKERSYDIQPLETSNNIKITPIPDNKKVSFLDKLKKDVPLQKEIKRDFDNPISRDEFDSLKNEIKDISTKINLLFKEYYTSDNS